MPLAGSRGDEHTRDDNVFFSGPVSHYRHSVSQLDNVPAEV